VAGNAADTSTTTGAGAAEKDILEFGFHSPRSNSLWTFRKRKRQRAVKDITAIMAEFLFDINRTLCFEAWLAIMGPRQAVFDRLGQMTVEASQTFARGLSAHGLVIGRK